MLLVELETERPQAEYQRSCTLPQMVVQTLSRIRPWRKDKVRSQVRAGDV